MNYELAKQLEDAGFPQPDEAYGYRFIIPSGGRIPHKTDESFYVPSLSELIAACGVHCEGLPVFKQLNWHAKRRTGYVNTPEGNVNAEVVGYWSAKARIGKGHKGHITEWGHTAEEAVAKLWLTLHQTSTQLSEE